MHRCYRESVALRRGMSRARIVMYTIWYVEYIIGTNTVYVNRINASRSVSLSTLHRYHNIEK